MLREGIVIHLAVTHESRDVERTEITHAPGRQALFATWIYHR